MIGLLRRDPPASRDSLILERSGEPLRITIKRVRGAKRYTLRVRAANRDVVLSMPARGSYDSARSFAERHVDWICAKLEKLPTIIPFEAGSIIPLRGVDHQIVHSEKRGNVWTEPPSTTGGPPQLCVGGDPIFLARRLCDFLKREARRDLDAAARRHALALGKQARRITIRDTVSRWGSCSADGVLNFSWRLIFAPPFVLDYLAAHEAAHLLHMNHSAAFWKTARLLAPDTDRAEAWLKAHGASLHRYGARAVREKVK